jgi:ABC-2 type transport system permease protein
MTATTTARASLDAVKAATPLPGAWRVGLARGGLEIKQFFRDRTQVAFTLAFPVVFLILLSSIFGEEIDEAGISVAQLFVPSMMGSGLMASSFQSLGVSIAQERENRSLRRLRGTPMPPAAYFLGKVWLVLVTGVLETALLLSVGVIGYGLRVPADPVRLFHLLWIMLLGMTAGALLGVAVSSVARTGASASAVVILPFQVLQFVSGVYIPVNTLPDWMIQVGSFFPLKWMCQGLRGVFLPDAAKVLEPAGAWEFGRVVLVLAAWCAGGLLLCLTTFRWKSRTDG